MKKTLEETFQRGGKGGRKKNRRLNQREVAEKRRKKGSKGVDPSSKDNKGKQRTKPNAVNTVVE